MHQVRLRMGWHACYRWCWLQHPLLRHHSLWGARLQHLGRLKRLLAHFLKRQVVQWLRSTSWRPPPSWSAAAPLRNIGRFSHCSRCASRPAILSRPLPACNKPSIVFSVCGIGKGSAAELHACHILFQILCSQTAAAYITSQDAACVPTSARSPCWHGHRLWWPCLADTDPSDGIPAKGNLPGCKARRLTLLLVSFQGPLPLLGQLC